MHYRHGTLNLAATTLLLSLTFPLLPVGDLGRLSAEAQTLQHRDEESDRAQYTAEVEQLLQQGFEQLYRSQLQEALASFQQVLAQSRETGNRSKEATALVGMAQTYIWLSQPEKSLETAQP
jgi:hypothetical protein